MARLDMHVIVCFCSEHELIDRLAGLIADHLAANRHPDGVAPYQLAEDLIMRLRAAGQILVREDLPCE
jgi:hypothetical protein